MDTNSCDAFFSFKEKLLNSKISGVGSISFQARVKYLNQNQEETDILNVSFKTDSSNPYPCTIELEEGQILNREKMRMKFDADINKYELTNDGTLVITNKTEQMNGDFIVKIIEC